MCDIVGSQPRLGLQQVQRVIGMIGVKSVHSAMH
jgi:hypothetical protein